jgi:ligand-binding SRPBCC domain-containing protein
MTLRHLERTQIVPRPIAQTFEFFSDPRNLERLTPKFLRFEFLAPPPLVVTPGAILDYRIRLYGVPVHWRTRIEIVEPPMRFVDVQDQGPYAHWRHSHTFRDIGGGRTEMKDSVEFALPLGVLGDAAYRLFVARSLAQIFDFRAQALKKIVGE